jgi:type I restriction enzyme S subunit
MYGATVGRVAMLGIHAATNQACAAAICRHDVMLPEFLFYLLQNEKQSLVNQAQGGAQPNISQTLIKKQEVSVPLLGEQTEIVRRVELLFAYADRLEARLQAAQTAAQRLTPALLAKAFRGELVPQDPNDEPAAELLRRLKEGSSGPAAQAKAGRKSGKKAT